MKQCFKERRFTKDRLQRLNTINAIIEEYQDLGLKLSLRQLYYQLVSRDIIKNVVQEYKGLSELLTDGRMAGIVDWEAIEDRVRVPSKPGSWDTPADILVSAYHSFRLDRMKGQSTYIELWVEKDAISGVLKPITRKYGINLLVNRGSDPA
mgnify:CR=1 FL=1